MSPAKTPSVPVGIQRLLRLAASDAKFRAQLFDQRDVAAAAVGVELTATERAVLRAATREQLEVMAQHLPPAAPSNRRERLRQTAATAAALLAGPGFLACDGCARPAGISPDVPPETAQPVASGQTAEPAPNAPVAPGEPSQAETSTPATPVPPVADAGSEPAPVAPKHNPMQSKGGAAPDEPPPPPPGPKTRGISPDIP